MLKTDTRKIPKLIFVFARLSRYNYPTFYEIKIAHFTIMHNVGFIIELMFDITCITEGC